MCAEVARTHPRVSIPAAIIGREIKLIPVAIAVVDFRAGAHAAMFAQSSVVFRSRCQAMQRVVQIKLIARRHHEIRRRQPFFRGCFLVLEIPFVIRIARPLELCIGVLRCYRNIVRPRAGHARGKAGIVVAPLAEVSLAAVSAHVEIIGGAGVEAGERIVPVGRSGVHQSIFKLHVHNGAVIRIEVFRRAVRDLIVALPQVAGFPTDTGFMCVGIIAARLKRLAACRGH